MGLPHEIREARVSEIHSDLWEHSADAAGNGVAPNIIAKQMIGRTFRGIASDLRWHIDELKGNTVFSRGQFIAVFSFLFLGIAATVFGLTTLITGIVQHRLFDDLWSSFLGVSILAFVLGPFIAVTGAYAWRRAHSADRDTKRSRAMVVAGTLAIVGLALMMVWPVLGATAMTPLAVYWIIASWFCVPPAAADSRAR